LFATYTVGDTDPSHLYGITDLLSATTRPGGALSRLTVSSIPSPSEPSARRGRTARARGPESL